MGKKSTASGNTRVACFPMPLSHAYYFWLYHEALERHGFEVVDTRGRFLTFRWLFENAGHVRILHFHWPAYLYSNSSFLVFLKRLTLFVVRLVTARLLGYKVVWTMHNIYPHEKNNPVLEYAGRFALVQIANVVFVHFSGARKVLRNKFFRKRNVFEIPHGNYHNIFTCNSSKAEARSRLGVPDGSFVYLILGQVRPYKGIDDAIETFGRTSRPGDVLLIAGNPYNNAEKEWLERETEEMPGVILFLRHIEEDEMEYFFKASDVVLLPYKSIFTSGNLFLAFTFGKPVIAPDMGIISELVDDSVGIKYTPDESNNNLTKALENIKRLDLESLGHASYERGLTFLWDNAADISADVYRNRLGL